MPLLFVMTILAAIFCDQIATFETEVHAKRYHVCTYFRLFSCKNWIWSSNIAFIVPCLFPLLLKLIAIDVLLSKVWPRAMKNNIKCHLWVINSLCYDRIYESLRLNGVDVQNKC